MSEYTAQAVRVTLLIPDASTRATGVPPVSIHALDAAQATFIAVRDDTATLTEEIAKVLREDDESIEGSYAD
ncbi:MAG: hypothetical protein HY318_05135 [Armatimonadetes bacterium]|nr:hypothetical protein [Armatimonadota bacterium]